METHTERPTLRPVTQRYVDGLVREVYTDTGELVPVPEYRPPRWLPTPRRAKSFAPKDKLKSRAMKPLFAFLLERDRGCVRCGTLAELSKHHVVHRSRGGGNGPDNLQLLCWPCHRDVHQVLRLPSGTRVLPGHGW